MAPVNTMNDVRSTEEAVPPLRVENANVAGICVWQAQARDVIASTFFLVVSTIWTRRGQYLKLSSPAS
jgi:hypothetical protein